MTAQKKTKTPEDIISLYMDYVLEHDREPASVYKFCKDSSITEQEFYTAAGSFPGLRKEIWNRLFQNAHEVALKSDGFTEFSAKDKMLTLLYTFFEVLTANRSYVLFTLDKKEGPLKSLEELSGLRKHIKAFAGDLIKETNSDKTLKILKHPVVLFSEGAWVQTLFILKYWMDDSSANFEKTDVMIEKTVRVIFDVFETTPLESIVDFGKFLWKEKMN